MEAMSGSLAFQSYANALQHTYQVQQALVQAASITRAVQPAVSIVRFEAAETATLAEAFEYHRYRRAS